MGAKLKNRLKKKKASPDDTPLLVGDEFPAELVEPWVDYFYGGKWAIGVPELPGWYQVATLQGDVVGMRLFVMRDGRVRDAKQIVNEPGWQGYHWSAAVPSPPKKV